MKPTVIVIHLTLLASTCLCQSALNVSQLHDDLLTLNPNVRPVSNMSEPTEVNVTFQLISIVSLDTASLKLVSNGWMKIYWMNHYTTWDPQDYGGVTSISPSADKMWRPRLTVRNSLKEVKPIGEEYVFMELQSNGLVGWFPGERYETACKVDITFFPFDIQTCTWELFNWGDNAGGVVLHSAFSVIQMSGYQENGEWDVVDTKAWTHLEVYGGYPVSRLYFEVTLKRRAALLVMTAMLPPVVLSFVNVFVFKVPSEAGERLAYAMTSFLTFGVFMSFIVDFLPSASHTISLLAINLTCQIIFSALDVLLCTLSLRLFYRDSIKHPVPPTLQNCVVRLEMLMCLDPPSQEHKSMTRTHQVISTDTSDFFGAEVKGGRLKAHLDKWAKERKEKQEAYSQPQDMTWQRVSRTLDKLLFGVFFCTFITLSTVSMSVTFYNYHKVD